MIRKPIAIVSLTNLSVAKGQTVASSADLAVMRDNLNRIFIPSTAQKGAAESKVVLTEKNGEIIAKILFGSTDESVGKINFKSHMGLIGFQDAYLVFIPVPSTIGLLYVTSPLLLLKLFEATNTDTTILAEIQEKLPDDTTIIGENLEIIDLAGGITLRAKSHPIARDLEKFVRDILSKAGLSDILNPHVGIVSDNIISIILNKALIIRPGIKIEGFEKDKTFYNKVVDKGTGPRFEEEVPLGSIFIGYIMLLRQQIELEKIVTEKKEVIEAIVDIIHTSKSITLSSNKIVFDENAFNSFLDKIKTMFIGGRETLAKGLVRLVDIPDRLVITQQKFEGQKNVVIMRERIRIANIKELIQEALEDKKMKDLVENLEKKVAGLPEKFRMMDPLTVLYFYLTIKRESQREGYEELRKLGEYILDKWGLKDILIKQSGSPSEGVIVRGIDTYLRLFDKVVRMFTLLKYIVRACGGK